MTPCSGVEIHWRFRVIYNIHHLGSKVGQTTKQRSRHEELNKKQDLVLAASFVPVLFLDYSPTLKIEALLSSETLVDVYLTTQRCIRGDNTLHWHNQDWHWLQNAIVNVHPSHMLFLCRAIYALIGCDPACSVQCEPADRHTNLHVAWQR